MERQGMEQGGGPDTSVNAMMAQDLTKRSIAAQQQAENVWGNVQNLHDQLGRVPVPQQQPLHMNPWAALLAGGAAALMNNRFVPQAQEFTGNLLGGLQHLNDVNYQNQQANYQAKMGQLSSAIQAAKDQSNNLYNLAGGLSGHAAQMLQWYHRDASNLAGKQIQADSMVQRFVLNNDVRMALARIHSGDARYKEIVDGFNHAAGGPEREMWFNVALQEYPRDFAGATMSQFAQAVRENTPKEQEQIEQADLDRARAGYLGIEGWRLQQLPPAQADWFHKRGIAATAQAQKAIADANVDPAKADFYLKRTVMLEPDFRLRYGSALAKMDQLQRQAQNPSNQLRVYTELLDNAKIQTSILNGQLSKLAKDKGGILPADGQAGQLAKTLTSELYGPNGDGTGGLAGRVAAYEVAIKNLLAQPPASPVAGSYMGRAGHGSLLPADPRAFGLNAVPSPTRTRQSAPAQTSRPQPGAPFHYVGPQMSAMTSIQGKPLWQYIHEANIAVQANPKARAEIIRRLAALKISVQ